ncbi:MAG TPA: flagellar filament capping protein FliD, partial [Leptolinea sp.]
FGTDSGSYIEANKATGAAKLNYAAQGATINVTSDMSLASIKAEINAATYGSGNEVIASIIDNTLILKNSSTGAAHVMQAADTSGTVLTSLGVLNSGTLNTKVTATNAIFSVNEMAMERSSNTGLTDVISGMTLDLASDAAGKSADLVIKNDVGSSQAVINSFLTSLNSLTSYVRDKTSTKKNADDTYTRGTLAGEYGIRTVGNELITLMNSDHENAGIYSKLADIGITVDTNLNATISDTTALTAALSNHYADVVKLFDSAMGSMSNKVGSYAGTSGYLSQTITTEESTVTSINSRIKSINERLSRREESLVKYYADYQAQMETFMNQSKVNTALYG